MRVLITELSWSESSAFSGRGHQGVGGVHHRVAEV